MPLMKSICTHHGELLTISVAYVADFFLRLSVIIRCEMMLRLQLLGLVRGILLAVLVMAILGISKVESTIRVILWAVEGSEAARRGHATIFLPCLDEILELDGFLVVTSALLAPIRWMTER